MAEELLNGPNVCPTLEEVRGKGVSQGMASGSLGDSTRPHSSREGTLNRRHVKMVAAQRAAIIAVNAQRRE
jgi:hypothetical protein